MTTDAAVLELGVGDYRLRPLVWDDVEALVRHADNPNVAANLRDAFPSPYRREDAENWIAAATAVDPPFVLAIADASELVGIVGLVLQTDVFRRSAEIGYWLGESRWGRGIATAATRRFTEYAFDTFDLVRIYAGVYESNPASARVLEKAGYTCEGRLRRSVTKRGRTVDEFLYARVLAEDRAED